MKLYTEDQVKEVVKKAIEDDYWVGDTEDDLLEDYIPIELPSDEEIREQSMEFYDNNGSNIYFIQGAKWVIEQIKQRNLWKIN